MNHYPTAADGRACSRAMHIAHVLKGQFHHQKSVCLCVQKYFRVVSLIEHSNNGPMAMIIAQPYLGGNLKLEPMTALGLALDC